MTNTEVNVAHGKSAEDQEYYTTDEIDKLKAHYNVIFGKRSNGRLILY